MIMYDSLRQHGTGQFLRRPTNASRPADTASFADHNSAMLSAVPANVVEIFQIPKT